MQNPLRRRGVRQALAAGLCLGLIGGARADEGDAADAAAYQDADVKFQSTYVWQRHGAFAAAYSGPNSLSAQREPRSYTLTATAFMGARTWPGGELYFNPEMVSSQSLSDLHGLGAMTNGEDQKGGGPNPTLYRARLFVRHTWGLGGGSEAVESAPNQLAGAVDKNRVVLTVGNFSVIDIFDNNAYAHDPRTQFLNWTIMTHGAFDFAADTRGYTSGAALEYYVGDWALRAGRFMQPRESNGLALDPDIFRHYGDQAEIERGYDLAGQPGKLRLLAFRNRARMGGFQDALDAWRAGGSVGVPAVAEVRTERAKTGFGVNLEQALSADLGAFLRASRNDGQSETYAFTEVERSLSGGASIKGTAWGRPGDVVGLGFVRNGLSAAHREYLANGGLGAFIGDGVPPAGLSDRYDAEQVVEGYYSARVAKGIWVSLDYQRARNPGYNAERGPVNFVGARLHLEL
ncbi:MAG: carbohydrate porin [Rhodocyclaceae bacterium]|nr:carbohydrate porin [Rhodocyclaceae bacterium]